MNNLNLNVEEDALYLCTYESDDKSDIKSVRLFYFVDKPKIILQFLFPDDTYKNITLDDTLVASLGSSFNGLISGFYKQLKEKQYQHKKVINF